MSASFRTLQHGLGSANVMYVADSNVQRCDDQQYNTRQHRRKSKLSVTAQARKSFRNNETRRLTSIERLHYSYQITRRAEDKG